jgi:hypothetical protein
LSTAAASRRCSLLESAGTPVELASRQSPGG